MGLQDPPSNLNWGYTAPNNLIVAFLGLNVEGSRTV